MWKINNNGNAPIKFAAAKTNEITIGIILKPGEFCICESRMTSSIDAQERRKFISVDRNYSNDLKLKLCECYNESAVMKAKQEAVDYIKAK